MKFILYYINVNYLSEQKLYVYLSFVMKCVAVLEN